jgi:hypothetical protein
MKDEGGSEDLFIRKVRKERKIFPRKSELGAYGIRSGVAQRSPQVNTQIVGNVGTGIKPALIRLT